MEQKIKTAKFLSRLLDSQFEIGSIKFGIDPIVNIVPWLGDIIGALLSLYILKLAKEIGVSRADYFKMIANITVDFIVGFIPFLGIIFDVFYKSNLKNTKILEKYMHGKFVEGEVVG